MHEVLERVVWIEFYVALWFVVAALICCAQRRHEPQWSAGLAAACLGTSFAIVLVGLFPLPLIGKALTPRSVSTVASPHEPSLHATRDQPQPQRVVAADSAEVGPRSERGALHAAARLLTRLLTARPAIEGTPAWIRWGWSGLCLGSFVFGVVRLLGGWARRARIVRSSVQVADSTAEKILARLGTRRLGRRAPRVLESHDVVSPATFGWRRATILLPAGWRQWSESELESVLAHELAHIERYDYPWWLVGKIAVALHAYHPAVHWLANHLQLQQEMAADRRAASRLGNPRDYLRALVRLSLQQDDIAASRMLATTFLPSPTTLFRRIEMLRIMDDSRKSRKHWLGRAVTLTAFLSALTLITVFQVTGQEPARPPRDTASAGDSPEPTQGTADSLPGPLTPANRIGIVKFRLADLLARLPQPVASDVIETLNSEVVASLEKAVGADLEMSFGSVQDLTLPLFLWITAPPADASVDSHRHALGCGLESVTLTHPVPHVEAVRHVLPGAVQETRGDITIYGLDRDSAVFRIVGPPAWNIPVNRANPVPFVWTRDQQTFVVAQQAGLEKAVANQWLSATTEFTDWQRAERGVVSFALEPSAGTFSNYVLDSDPVTAAQKQALTELVRCHGYVELTDELVIDLTFCFNSDAAAQNGEQQLRAVIAVARLALLATTDAGDAAPGAHEIQKLYSQLQRTLLEGAAFEIRGSEVHARAAAPMELAMACLERSLDSPPPARTARGAGSSEVK